MGLNQISPPGGLNREFMVHSASMTLTNDACITKKWFQTTYHI